MAEIVKVQQAIASPGKVLIYAKDGRNLREMPMPDDLQDKIGDDMKAYFHATWTGKTWCIRDRAPDQEW